MITRPRVRSTVRITCAGLAVLVLGIAAAGAPGILAAAVGEPAAPATPPPPEQQPSAVPGVLTVGQEPGQAQITQLLILLAEQLDLATDRAEAQQQQQAAANANPSEPGAVLRLAQLTQDLSGRVLPILIAVAPLMVVGAALAMQFGARRYAPPVMYAAIGSVVVVMLARGLAA